MTTPVEVIAKKILGSAGGGFGVVFCALNDQNYFKVLINLAGMYKISRVIAGEQNKILRDWRSPLPPYPPTMTTTLKTPSRSRIREGRAPSTCTHQRCRADQLLRERRHGRAIGVFRVCQYSRERV